jgi:hypothetical protein
MVAAHEVRLLGTRLSEFYAHGAHYPDLPIALIIPIYAMALVTRAMNLAMVSSA